MTVPEMLHTRPHVPNARLQLAEAMREIQVMSGIGNEAGTDAVTIGVTSPDFGDGKTTVSIALTASISRDFEVEAMLVDADFHTHSIGTDFGLKNEQGLAEIIAGTQRLEDVTHRVARARMSVVTAGQIPTDPARLARSEHLITLIENMKRASKYIVIDLPAALRSMNTPVLARRCDGVIVVVRYGHTTQADLDRTLHLLQDSNVLGVVVNRQRQRTPAWVRRALSFRS